MTRGWYFIQWNGSDEWTPAFYEGEDGDWLGFDYNDGMWLKLNNFRIGPKIPDPPKEISL